MVVRMPRRRPPQRFDRRVAVVTGASSGIGQAIALTLAERGAMVVGLARRKERLDELVPELARRSPGSTTAVCDVGERRRLPGGPRTDRGRTGTASTSSSTTRGSTRCSRSPAGRTAPSRRVFDVNFFATTTGTLAVLPGMVDRGWGVVVNVSSDTVRAPEPRQGAYAASKAAVSAFSECVAHEVAPRGVHVHVLYPGWVPTAMGLSGNEDGGSLPPEDGAPHRPTGRDPRGRPDGRAAHRHQRRLAPAAGAHRPDTGAAQLPEGDAAHGHDRPRSEPGGADTGGDASAAQK